MTDSATLIPAFIEKADVDDPLTWTIQAHGYRKLPDDVIKALAHGMVWLTIQRRDPSAVIDIHTRERLTEGDKDVRSGLDNTVVPVPTQDD